MNSPLLTSLFSQNGWKLALSFFAFLGTGHLILEGKGGGGWGKNRNKKFMHKKSRRIKFVYKEAREKDHTSPTYSWDLYNRLVKKGNFIVSILFEQFSFGP